MPLHTELHFIRMKASYLRALNSRPSSRHLLTCGFVPFMFCVDFVQYFLLAGMFKNLLGKPKCQNVYIVYLHYKLGFEYLPSS